MRKNRAIACGLWLGVLGAVGCSGTDDQVTRGAAAQEGTACSDGAQRACTCAGGAEGTQACSSGWQACDCSQPAFNNADASTVVMLPDAGSTVRPGDRLPDCDPGFYLGTYNCMLMGSLFPAPLMGDVSFDLEIDEEAVANDSCDAEFCPDLVISESSGILFGLTGFIGFEAKLEGGLDCTTGEFRANAPMGIWGNAVSSDPNNPNAKLTVQPPGQGTFGGTLMGTHLGGSPQVIDGEWDLHDDMFGMGCIGPFTVERQP